MYRNRTAIFHVWEFVFSYQQNGTAPWAMQEPLTYTPLVFFCILSGLYRRHRTLNSEERQDFMRVPGWFCVAHNRLYVLLKSVSELRIWDTIYICVYMLQILSISLLFTHPTLVVLKVLAAKWRYQKSHLASFSCLYGTSLSIFHTYAWYLFCLHYLLSISVLNIFLYLLPICLSTKRLNKLFQIEPTEPYSTVRNATLKTVLHININFVKL